ncbi:4-amino-4-deoxychorismate lyase [Rhizobium subbaraonis]|uniref:Probable branched-chain-amino-acid aminotransferase n=1 Tax=Rhizobium subbaraonis TaxID=908946 RepID=A0A285U8R9_9HYPH|nr:aminotransferase class IV family protein [Rhizobium subbaraonis]SOC36936.1 4-amino-4-deoxychorismate lyase [Rhizobium subbaraonis]
MDISLIETLRWEPESGFVRLERHLERLAASAKALNLTNADRAASALRNAVSHNPETPLRVRLELFVDGRIEVKTAPFAPLPTGAVWTVKISRTTLASDDPLLRHKTSHRTAYEAARAEFAAGEADEVILLNEHGEICEGTITSIFLDDGSGILRTPPLSCGLLAGVLRAELLESDRAREARMRPQDLDGHTFFMGNSLRGLIPAVLA